MPAELRYLIFESAETIQAIREYYQRQGIAVPNGSVLRAQADQRGSGNAPRFCMRFKPQMQSGPFNDKAPHEIVVEGELLAAALIIFCHSRRIPLPANAEKALRLHKGRIGLVLTNNPANIVMPQIEM